MNRVKRVIVAMLSLAVAFVMTLGSVSIVYAGNIEDPELWTNFNVEAVGNGPDSSTTTFTLDDTYLITSITDYHWNRGQGADPGKIAIKQNGKRIGVWQAEGRGGSGAENVNWDIFPDIVLEPGEYEIADSDPDTWSQNSGSNGHGFILIRGVPAADSSKVEKSSSKKDNSSSNKDNSSSKKDKSSSVKKKVKNSNAKEKEEIKKEARESVEGKKLTKYKPDRLPNGIIKGKRINFKGYNDSGMDITGYEFAVKKAPLDEGPEGTWKKVKTTQDHTDMSSKIGSLEKGGNYYYRYRLYKTIDGIDYYSKWSDYMIDVYTGME